MAQKQLEAHFENRVYYFYLKEKSEKLVSVEMYSTPYVFVNVNGTWENHLNNKNNMAKGLILAVIEATEKGCI